MRKQQIDFHFVQVGAKLNKTCQWCKGARTRDTAVKHENSITDWFSSLTYFLGLLKKAVTSVGERVFPEAKQYTAKPILCWRGRLGADLDSFELF